MARSCLREFAYVSVRRFSSLRALYVGLCDSNNVRVLERSEIVQTKSEQLVATG